MILLDIPQLPPPLPVIPIAVVQPLQRYKPPHSGTLGGGNVEGRHGGLERSESRPGSVNVPPTGSPQASRPPSTMSVAKSAGPEQQKSTSGKIFIFVIFLVYLL